ncbi:MAG: toprim domain-containing protein [Chitinophagaceae bacterium]
MNIEQAKSIPLSKIIETLGRKPIKSTGKQSWYISPWRDEQTASLHVHNDNNWWFDFGIGVGGNSISFVQQYLKANHQPNAISDALHWLENTASHLPIITETIKKPLQKSDQTLTVKSVKQIKHRALIHYLEKRGIPLSVANGILKEVRICNSNTNKNIFALGLLNEDDGYEIRNPLIKICVGKKSLSFIRGSNHKPDNIHIFEGFMDYLSIITQRNGKKLKDDSIILNSVSCIQKSFAYIKGYGYKTAYTWMDNDEAGKNATAILNEFFKSEESIEHSPMNKLYVPYKDVNAWHMHKLEL